MKGLWNDKTKRNSIDESNLILSQVNSIIQNTESYANIWLYPLACERAS
ncbi:hypothetical protein [Paenibacillus elgii]